VITNLDEIVQALRGAQEKADATGQPVAVGFVAYMEDGSWVATDGEVQPSQQ
jgi:hypothetical protein